MSSTLSHIARSLKVGSSGQVQQLCDAIKDPGAFSLCVMAHCNLATMWTLPPLDVIFPFKIESLGQRVHTCDGYPFLSGKQAFSKKFPSPYLTSALIFLVTSSIKGG